MRGNAATALGTPNRSNRTEIPKMQVNLTARPPARTLPEICEAVRLANCGHCWAVPGEPCVIGPDGACGFHVARFGRAFRRGLISGANLVAVLAVPDAFTNATVICTGGPR